MLFAKLEAGAISLSLADVLAFGVTILAAVYLARLITTLLEEDVYPRVRLSRGVAYAVSTVVRYGVLLLGFLVAVGAMGFGMDRITILLGAFGVGLGFGLQNIVNNFVSGLILIFERPVQVGDSVEVGAIKGKVSRIGIRSSSIRTFDGADVTLPNGTLLSEALTNWTQSDRLRRIEIAVGVAYGTDPDAVIEVLREAENRQQGLVDDPAPQVLFQGFGESSLDFLLRAWVEDNDQWVTIQSDLALAVNRGLRERDIEVPFPQRDLHLRSIAPELREPQPSRETGA
jgi:potassium efflux system protein